MNISYIQTRYFGILCKCRKCLGEDCRSFGAIRATACRHGAYKCNNPRPRIEVWDILLFVWNKFYFVMLSFCLRYYRNSALVSAALVEIHNAVNESVESIVFADTYILTRVVLCAALANDDVACDNLLAAPNLNT